MRDGFPRLLEQANRAERHTHPLLAVLVALAVSVVPPVVLVTIVAAALHGGYEESIDLSSAVRSALFLITLAAVTVGLLWLWLRFYERRPLWTVGFRGSHRARRAARGLALALVVNLTSLVVVYVGGWGDRPATGLSAAWPSIVAWLAVMAVAFTVQSVGEEIIFRGFLTQSIGLRWNLTATVVIQAVCFTAVHFMAEGSQVVAYVAIFITGVLLAGYVLLEGDLWGACGFHMGHNWSNTVAVVLLYDAPGFGIIQTGMLFVAMLAVLVLLRRRGVARVAPQHTTR